MKMTTFLDLITEPDSINSYSLEQQHVFIRGARKAGLLATLAAKLQQEPAIWAQLDDGIRRHLLSALIYSERQHQQIHHEVDLMQGLLKDADFECYFLKGAGYVVREDSAHPGRIMSDVDVLVDKNNLNTFETLLLRNRWVGKKVSDYDDKYYREWAHELPPMLNVERNTTLDLHHNIVPPISNRMPDSRWFTEGALRITDKILVLRPAATILHSAVHLILNEEFHHGLRDLADINNMLQTYSNDEFWQDLPALARQAGFQQELLFALQLQDSIWHNLPEVQQAICHLQKEVKKPFHNFWLRCYRSAIVPEISEFDNLKAQLARFMVFLRGHMQKMPLPVLIRHLSFKSYLSFKQKVLGQQPQI